MKAYKKYMIGILLLLIIMGSLLVIYNRNKPIVEKKIPFDMNVLKEVDSVFYVKEPEGWYLKQADKDEIAKLVTFIENLSYIKKITFEEGIKLSRRGFLDIGPGAEYVISLYVDEKEKLALVYYIHDDVLIMEGYIYYLPKDISEELDQFFSKGEDHPRPGEERNE